jgi:type IX secretion system PorP/SprF family membrane protein
LKKIYLLLSILLLSLTVGRAQQKAVYNQYMLNGYLLNPALTGQENYLDLKASYRNQWSGMAGAPASFYVSAQGPLNKADRSSSLVSLPARGKNAIINTLRLKSENDFRILKPHHGLGGMVLGDNMGPESRLGASLTYAYHLPVNRHNLKLSAGLSGGFTRYRLDASRLDFGSQADPMAGQYYGDMVLPEIGAGLMLYGRNFYAGASAAQLFQGTINLSPNPAADPSRFHNHYFVTGGYELRPSREISVLPSLLVRYAPPTPLTVDVNLKVAYLRQVWGGLSYRHNNAFSVLGGANINKLVSVGYAYEVATTSLYQYNTGSHELMVGLALNNTSAVRNR